MTREELINEIERAEQEDFLLQMKDHWSLDDYQIHDYNLQRIRELKSKLEK